MLLYSCNQKGGNLMNYEEKIATFKQSDFWQQVKKDARIRASKNYNWKRFDDPNSHYVSGAKESTREALIEWALNDLFIEFDMEAKYSDVEAQMFPADKFKCFKELEQKVKANPDKYNDWKNGN